MWKNIEKISIYRDYEIIMGFVAKHRNGWEFEQTKYRLVTKTTRYTQKNLYSHYIQTLLMVPIYKIIVYRRNSYNPYYAIIGP